MSPSRNVIPSLYKQILNDNLSQTIAYYYKDMSIPANRASGLCGYYDDLIVCIPGMGLQQRNIIILRFYLKDQT